MMEEWLKNFYVTDAIAAAACRQAVESTYAKATGGDRSAHPLARAGAAFR
jgi:hypothetical protein